MFLYYDVFEKFKEKGYSVEFHYFVLSPPLINGVRFYNITREEAIEIHKETVEEVYGEEWDYWNTWIDYQQYKFD